MKATRVEDDLCILHWGVGVRYRGTRAQLLEEGLVDPQTVFPVGKETVTWMRDGLQFTLAWGRAHPARGPRNVPKDPDWWVLDTTVPGRDWRWAQQQRIKEIEAQLRLEIYRQTPAGCREYDEHLRRYVAATKDRDFLAFKRACMPGRAATARGRRATEAG